MFAQILQSSLHLNKRKKGNAKFLSEYAQEQTFPVGNFGQCDAWLEVWQLLTLYSMCMS